MCSRRRQIIICLRFEARKENTEINRSGTKKDEKGTFWEKRFFPIHSLQIARKHKESIQRVMMNKEPCH